MAKHRLTGKVQRLPRGMRGRAQHRAVSYFWEYMAIRSAMWLAVHVLTPRLK